MASCNRGVTNEFRWELPAIAIVFIPNSINYNYLTSGRSLDFIFDISSFIRIPDGDLSYLNNSQPPLFILL